MGWSGYEPRFYVACRMYARGGKRQKQGERLYEQFVTEIDEVIKVIIAKPEYAQINPYYGGYAPRPVSAD
jgi:phage gpG-like protein